MGQADQISQRVILRQDPIFSVQPVRGKTPMGKMFGIFKALHKRTLEVPAQADSIAAENIRKCEGDMIASSGPVYLILLGGGIVSGSASHQVDLERAQSGCC